MPYKVDFLGLVCFLKEDNGGRLALLPDGREPGVSDIDPHFPEIIVEADDVIGGNGWNSNVTLSDGRLHFDLPRCTVEIDGAGQEPVSLNVDEHNLPLLSDANAQFAIDPATTNAVVRLPLRRGTLRVFRDPRNSQDDAAIISQLEVQHEGDVMITVRRRGSGRVPNAVRRIVLRAGAEIVISNVSRARENTQRHFRLYERLADRPDVSLERLGGLLSPAGLNPLPPTHRLFRAANSAGSGVDCGNTGCCRR